MIVNDKYNLQTNILSQADDFCEAFHRCTQGKNPAIDEFGRTKYAVVNIPAIVNAAFACELYLKSLLGKKGEHNLKNLFELLDTDKQEQIRSYVDKKFDKHCIYSFDFCLKRAANVFIEWRYIYEENHTDGFMGCFINEYLIFFSYFTEILKNLAHSNNSF